MRRLTLPIGSALNVIGNSIMKIGINKIELKYSGIDDPIAQKTGWGKTDDSIGANFDLSILTEGDSDTLFIKPSIYLKLFIIMFVVGGGIVPMTIGILNLTKNPIFPLFLLFGVFFSYISLKLLSKFYIVYSLDKFNGVITKTQPWFFLKINKNPPISFGLSKIHALQILQYGKGSDDEIRADLNLVMKDSTRINIMSAIVIDRLRYDANKISNYLHIPIWDAA